MPMITNCINRRYGLAINYQACQKAVQDVRREIHSYIDFTQTQTLQLLQMLEKMKTEDPQLKFSYMFDTSLHQRERLDPENP